MWEFSRVPFRESQASAQCLGWRRCGACNRQDLRLVARQARRFTEVEAIHYRYGSGWWGRVFRRGCEFH